MFRKVKVVPVENVEIIKVSPEPDAPEAEPEVVVPESAAEIENTGSDKTEVVADTAPPQSPEAPEETKSKKKDEKMTCPVCNKTMLSKTYKYTHQALCKPKEPEPKVQQPKPKKEPKPKTKEIPNVSFNDFKEMKELMPAPPPDYATQYKAARDQRQQVRTQRVKSLISQAI